MLPRQPRSTCLECKSYSFVYSSIVNLHKCLECDQKVQNRLIDNIVTAFSVFRSNNPPMLIPKYNSIFCISCLQPGGISFKDQYFFASHCVLCDYSVSISFLHDALVAAYSTKLIETTYNTKYSVFGEPEKQC